MSNGSPSALRILNDQAALSLLADADVVSRSDLEKFTGLSKPAANELLVRLETAQMVEKAGVRTGNRGPGAQLWRLRSDAGYAAAANVTPAAVQIRISDLRGTELASVRAPQDDRDAGDQVSTLLVAATIQAGVRQEDIRQLVVGVPGAVDPRTGIVKYAPHLPGWQGFDLASRISECTGIETEVENDVNLMAVSEMSRQAKDFSDYALVWIDEGAGAALVIGGQLFRGFSGGAGEIDYVRVSSARIPSSNLDRFGAKWGDLLGPQAIYELAAACGLDGVDSAEKLAAAMDSSARADTFLVDFGAEIAAGLTAIVTVLDPELIMLSGVFGCIGGERLADIVADQLAELVPSTADNRTRISSLPLEPDAALLGAAQIAMERARAIVFQRGSLGTGADTGPQRSLLESNDSRR